jgi:hypothetical protein
LKHMAGGSGIVHQLETPESSVHRVPMPWTNNSPVTPDSLANSAVDWSGSGSGGEENVTKATPYSDAVRFVFFHFSFVI